MEQTIKAGYILEFRTEKDAADAFPFCAERAEGTGWQDKACVIGNTVQISMNTPLNKEVFHDDGYDGGNTLFQKICFSLAGNLPGISYTGICRAADAEDAVKIRINVSFRAEELCFRMKKSTPVSVSIQSVYWNRKPDGSFEKSEFGTLRAKAKQG